MITDYEFHQEIESLAQMIVDEYDYESTDDDYHDGCWETADGHQWVIYTAKAKAICSLPSSTTDEGEEWLEGCYETPYAGCDTFSEVCTRLAFATMYCHLQSAVYELLEAKEAA